MHFKEQASISTGKACFSSKQNTASSIHSKQFFTLSNLILFTCFAKLATAWNYLIDRWNTQTSVQMSSNNLLNPKLSFPPRKRNVRQNLRRFFTPRRLPVILIRRPEAKRRNYLSVWQPLSSVTLCLVWHQLSPLKPFSGCESIPSLRAGLSWRISAKSSGEASRRARIGAQALPQARNRVTKPRDEKVSLLWFLQIFHFHPGNHRKKAN